MNFYRGIIKMENWKHLQFTVSRRYMDVEISMII